MKITEDDVRKKLKSEDDKLPVQCLFWSVGVAESPFVHPQIVSKRHGTGVYRLQIFHKAISLSVDISQFCHASGN